MDKIFINVPDGIKYLSDWNEFWATMPTGHCIVNKGVCGCGATESFIRWAGKVILASPRKWLLYNKYSQHLGDYLHLYRFQGDRKKFFEGANCTQSDVLAYQNNLSRYIHSDGRKILTTYDSLGKVMEALYDSGENFGEWTVVVDEFQLIFHDCQFKADTEWGFTQLLQQFPTVVYLSATPFLENYLDALPEFQGLTMYELRWPGQMVQTPHVEVVKTGKPVSELCCGLIAKYRAGEGRTKLMPDGSTFTAREAVFYINNVALICKIIKKAHLRPEEANIICSSVPVNVNRLNKLSKEVGMCFTIGEIPGRGEPHKMFTFCTSTAYSGSDFYSTNAYSYIFANPQLSCMAVDVSVDLQQILGRQRLEENPFRGSATLYFNTKKPKVSHEELEASIRAKNEKTDRQIQNYQAVPNPSDFLGLMEQTIRTKGHQKDYCCILRDAGGNTQVVKNALLEVAERRAWEVSNQIYNNDFSMYRALRKGVNITQAIDTDDADLQKLFTEWTKDNSFPRKAQMYCRMYEELPDLLELCTFIEPKFRSYHEALGREGLEALHWREDYIRQALAPTPFDHLPKDQIAAELIKTLVVGRTYTKSDVKKILQNIYARLRIAGKPSASDINEYLTCRERSERIAGKKTAVLKIVSPYRKKISVFSRITDVNHPQEYDVDKVLDIIKNNTYFHLESKVGNVRAQADKESNSRAKKKLSAAIWNGTFSTKNQHSLLTYSSFTALDFDNVDPQQAQVFKEWLKTFPCVYAIFETPNRGYKAIILHDNYEPLYHYDLYNQLLRLFQCQEQDASTIDLARAHYLSYDPDLWLNPNPVPYHFVPSTPEPIMPGLPTETVVKDVHGNDILQLDDSPVALFLNQLSRTVISDDSIIRILRKIWTGAAIAKGRNNAAMSYAGVLCKAGVEKAKAKDFIESLIPGFDITGILDYAYSHNIFGCERRRYCKRVK